MLRNRALMLTAVLLAACSSDGGTPAPPDQPPISVTTVRGALLRAAEVGPTWTTPAESAAPPGLVALCGGEATVPAVPPGAEVVAAPLADEGEKGAQSLFQTALVFPDAAAAQAGLAGLRAVADGCPATASVPARVTDDRSEPAYTETAAVTPLTEGQWTGFVVQRRKVYEPAHPGAADTAVAVLASRNVLLVDQYAIYRLGATGASPQPQFATDWQKLVGTVTNRLG